MGRTTALAGSVLVAAVIGVACSSSDSGAGGGAGTGGSGGADASAGAAGTAGGAGMAGAAGSAGGCAAGAVTLQNDAFVNNSQVGFEGGFVVGECWASTYMPQACSFDLTSALVLVGGGDGGNADFTVGVWDVDATGKPQTELASTQVTITGASDVLSEIPLNTLGLAPRDGTPFAIAMCHVNHDGTPSIGRDSDGITANKNWIFTNKQWVEAGTLGVKGDWIMRAKITNK